MKKQILFFFVLLFGANFLFAQIQSNGTGGGDWNTGSTWVGGIVPTSSDDVVIVSGDSVSLVAAGSCAGLTLQANAKLALNAASLTIPGTSWSFNSTSTVYYNGTTTISANPTYGNLYYMTNASGNPGTDKTLTVAGNFYVTANTFRGISAATGTNIINVTGDVIIGPGTSARISAVNSSSTTSANCTWNIGGNVYLTGNNSNNRIILQESAGPHSGASIININGNLTIGVASQVQFRSSTNANTGTGTSSVSVKGNILHAGSISSSSGGSGYSHKLILNGTSTQHYAGKFPVAMPSGQTLTVQFENSNGVVLDSSVTLNSNNTFVLKANNLTLNSTSLSAGVGTISVTHTAPDFSGSDVTTLDDGGYSVTRRSNQYWMLSHNFTSGSYSLALDGGSQNGITDPANLRIIHSTDGSAFDLVGTHSAGSGTTANRTGIGFTTKDRFYLGGQDLTTNPLPVELTKFFASVNGNNIELKWTTATETNNAGFEIERAAISNQSSVNSWTKVGFIEGAGSSNSTKNYSFTDNAAAGKYSYRLKQVDRSGSFSYSNVVEVSVAFSAADYQLTQNYPNPFNPTTTFSFVMKNDEYATVKVFNLIGQEVGTLFNGMAKADTRYTMNFDGKNLPSGIYFYSLRSKTRNEVRKMILNK